MKFPTRYPNLNALWSSLILEELWRLGVRDCCIAPGSRSAPLTLAAATHSGLKKHIHFDERGLGFFALGLAKQSQRPVAVIMTSGTAVANLYPAMIEARQSRVPLIIISADRPPELIDCGANQAINQQGIYAGYPGATLNFPAPTVDVTTRWVLTSVDQAFAQSCQQGLPMHINCMFREPLYPNQGMQDYSTLLESHSYWLGSDQPHTVYCSQVCDAVVPDTQFWQGFIRGKGILVVGRIEVGVDVDAIVRLADQLKWPILADIQSQLHGHPAVIKYADLLLASDSGKKQLAEANNVLQIGGYFVSKRLKGLLESGSWQNYVMLSEECRRIDTGHRQTRHVVGAVSETCHSLLALSIEENIGTENRREWLEGLDTISYRLSSCIRQRFDGDGPLTECWIGASLSKLLPVDCGLFLGNSLSVRLLDILSSGHTCNVYTNRGVSGIDGLIATASGCAAASAKPFVAVIGDLSFLHDLNSLALANKADQPLVLIVLNNDGGGIFNLLPLGSIPDQAETYFQTPHGLDASDAAAMFGINYHSPTDRSQFKDLLSEALSRAGCSLIEVKTMPGDAVRQISDTVEMAEVL